MDSAHRIVSSEAEELILVDRDDQETGYLSKADCHNGEGILHRAFSVFLFDEEGRVLLQRRAESKRLWPGYWSNSCCSHPRRGETMEIATRRRLNDELNIETALEFVYQFCYTASFGDAGSENELCHVYLGRTNDNVGPNASEIASIRFVSANALGAEMRDFSERFTPWFKQEWEELCGNHSEMLASYCTLDQSVRR